MTSNMDNESKTNYKLIDGQLGNLYIHYSLMVVIEYDMKLSSASSSVLVIEYILRVWYNLISLCYAALKSCIVNVFACFVCIAVSSRFVQ